MSKEPTQEQSYKLTEENKKQYVVGFLFNDDKVALIEKNRPEWQIGRLNGIGGHIEKGELPLEAMKREFSEEAGDFIERWEYYCTMNYPESIVYFFRLFGDYQITTKTDEKVGWYSVNNLPDNVIPNLNFLIPLALYTDKYLIDIGFNQLAKLSEVSKDDEKLVEGMAGLLDSIYCPVCNHKGEDCSGDCQEQAARQLLSLIHAREQGIRQQVAEEIQGEIDKLPLVSTAIYDNGAIYWFELGAEREKESIIQALKSRYEVK